MTAIDTPVVSNNYRDDSIDTLKFVLMCFVIFGHCLEVFQLHKSFFLGRIYQFIYLFHMPLFVFISGYFLNRTQEKGRFYSGILFILETYIVFQLPAYVLSSIHGIKNPISLFDPTWAMWYLPSLIIWRVIVYNLPSSIISNKTLVLSLLLIFSILGGLVDYTHFAFQRIITFFPFFVIGYYCKTDGLLSKVKRIPRGLSIVVIVAALVGLFIVNVPTSNLFYQNAPYYSQPISVGKGLLFRGEWYVVTIVLSCVILSLLLDIKSQKLAYYGRFTLLFYVCHVFFFNYFRIFISELGLANYPILSLVVFFVVVSVLCWISKHIISRFITNPISTTLHIEKWL